MKRVVDVLYGLKGYPNAARFTTFKTDLFANGSTPAIVVDTAVATGITVSSATTTGILLSGTATTGLSLTGAQTTGISITGTKTTFLTIGVSATPVVVSATARGIDVYTTSIAATGTVRSVTINQTQTVASASTILEALRVNIDSNVKTGNWVNAIVGRIDYGAAGNADGGMCAAGCF